RRSSARRSRDSRFSNWDEPEAVTLFEVVSIGKRAIQSVVDDWIEAYQEDRDVALLDLFNFYIQCSGCQGVVTAELFQNPNNQELKKKMTEEFDEDAEVYPMIKPGTYWKKFKANFCEFTTVLVQQCQYSVIYDGYLLDTVISLLLGLADSYVRAFRHTSTLSAMKLLSALVMVVLNLNVSLDNTERLLMVEKKRAAFKKTNSRLEQLDKKWRELQQQHQEIENFMEVLFKGTFVQRYRDVVPEIRALCIEELGIWMRLYPKVYLNDSCLKYIGWMLYDKVGLCNTDRIVSMTLDRDHDVSVQAMKLLVNCEDVLTREDCETLYQFVYAAHRPLATAAGEFLYKRYLEFVISQTIPAICSNLISRPLLCLGKVYCKPFFSPILHEHLTYLVDSLWECTSGFLKDWQCMSTVLLQDGNRGENALTANQESRLIELILASVRQAVEGHPPVGRGSSRKVCPLFPFHQILYTVINTGCFLFLPQFISDPVKITNLLQIPQYFDMEIYSARSMDKNLEALLKQIHSIVENHSVPEVLEACSKAYQSLSNESLASHVRVSLSKRQLIEQLVDSFNQKLEDLLQQVSISLSRTVVPNRGPQVTPTGQVFQICEAQHRNKPLHYFLLRTTGLIEKDDETSLSHLHRRRSLLAGYCRLIAYNAVEMSAAAEIYKQYMKTYTDFGDIIKETLSRTRQNNRIESAKTLVLCLQQLYQKHRELHGSATQSSTSFTNIKELARRFSLTFGMDHVKCRESIAMIHKLGIEFAFRERAEDGQPPPNLPFLILISEFSSKLLKADKRLVYGYLQRFANEQMLLYRGTEWHPLIMYNNSLLDNQDEDGSFTGSFFSQDLASSSISQSLKRKPSFGKHQMLDFHNILGQKLETLNIPLHMPLRSLLHQWKRLFNLCKKCTKPYRGTSILEHSNIPIKSTLTFEMAMCFYAYNHETKPYYCRLPTMINSCHNTSLYNIQMGFYGSTRV
uniref:Cohesin subunit SA n=1 Tax=Leptobrachium leishanense TaxID=445787 RepID=A0A8C5LXQ0_9ANUR